MEQWKEIIEFPNVEVSSHGNVREKSSGNNIKCYNKNGYKRFSKNSSSTQAVHRLVATYFCDNKDNKPIVNHIDENKTNNHYENLEWVTQMENVSKYNENNTGQRKSKEVDVYTRDGVYIKSFFNVISAAKELNLTRTNVSKCVNGINPTAGGYVFKFKNTVDHTLDKDTGSKKISGYDNYTVFEDGKIYSIKNKRYLKPCKNANGNVYVSLVNDGKKKNMYIQRIVAENYLHVPDDFSKKSVIHIDGNKENNHYKNLKII